MRPPDSPEVLREVLAVWKIRAFLCANLRLRRFWWERWHGRTVSHKCACVNGRWFRRKRWHRRAIHAQGAIDRYGFTG